jgi:hypothetical protein
VKGIEMKKLFCGMMALTALASALALSAQAPAAAPAQAAPAAAPAAPALPADEIVSKYLDAIGGKAALSQVKSVSMDATVQVMGNEAPNTTVIADGVGYKSDTDFNGSKIITCLNSKGGWQVNPMAGAADPTPMPDDEYKAGKDQIFVEELLDYSAKGGKVELVSTDATSYKIKLTTKDNVETTYVIDAKTFLAKSAVRKGKMQGADVEVTTSFSDYRKTDVGYLMPYNLDIDLGGQFSLTIVVKKVELNKTIDPAIFEMPKPAAASPASPASEAPKPN